MARTGPVTKDTTTIAIGYAQVRVGASATNIAQTYLRLTSSDSIGALANVKLNASAEYFKLESGYPMLEDATFPLREAASIEAAFKEITPKNFALAKGLDISTGYASAHVGSIALGTISTPAFIRCETQYTYPDGYNTMNVIFPRAQATANIEMEFAEAEPAAVATMIEAKRADSEVTGGSAVWDSMPLGRIVWATSGSSSTTSSTTTTTTAP
jgi:hypothetical protein